MHNNRFWLGFLTFCTAVTLWYSGNALYKMYHYSRLTAQTSVQDTKWSVQKISDEMFVLKSAYVFAVNGKAYAGATKFEHDYYRNQWGAEQAIAAFTKTYNRVWYSPSNPDYSSLQKSFPTKECISAAILVALLLYFFWLGFYVVRYQN